MNINSPIISRSYVIKDKNIEYVYNKCLSWLKKNEGRVLKRDEPNYIKAKHEKISGRLGHVSIVDWPKIIEIKLNQELNGTIMAINIDPEEKSIIDRYDNRTELWPIIIGKILLYLGEEIDEKERDILFPKIYYINQIRREGIALLFMILMQILLFYEFIMNAHTETSLLFLIILFFILERRSLIKLNEIHNEMKKQFDIRVYNEKRISRSLPISDFSNFILVVPFLFGCLSNR